MAADTMNATKSVTAPTANKTPAAWASCFAEGDVPDDRDREPAAYSTPGGDANTDTAAGTGSGAHQC
jgi:hypothetical protein